MGTGLVIAMAAGWVVGRLKLERWIEDWVRQQAAGTARRRKTSRYRGAIVCASALTP